MFSKSRNNASKPRHPSEHIPSTGIRTHRAFHAKIRAARSVTRRYPRPASFAIPTPSPHYPHRLVLLLSMLPASAPTSDGIHSTVLPPHSVYSPTPPDSILFRHTLFGLNSRRHLPLSLRRSRPYRRCPVPRSPRNSFLLHSASPSLYGYKVVGAFPALSSPKCRSNSSACCP